MKKYSIFSGNFFRITAAFLFFSAVRGADIFLNNVTGDDLNSGRTPSEAVRTQSRAIDLSRPSDRIIAANTGTVYDGSIAFTAKSGEKGKPIIFDGSFAVFRGTRPIDFSGYTHQGNGLYSKETDLSRLQNRYFIVFGGRMENMGRCSKGNRAPWKKKEQLGDYEFSYDESARILYLKIPSQKSLSECSIEAPEELLSGIAVMDSSHLIFRNIIVTHFWNDGCNLHKHCDDIRFENIIAFENGDDSVSAHETGTLFMSNFIGIRNSTGIANSSTTQVTMINCWFEDIIGQDVLIGLNKTGLEHILRNAWFEGSSPRGVLIAGCAAVFENCVFLNKRATPVNFTMRDCTAHLKNCYQSNHTVLIQTDNDSREAQESLTRSKMNEAVAVKDYLTNVFRAVFGGTILTTYGFKP